MAKWKNKYRIESARAPWWDYGSDGGYFITICTENRKHFFGECKNGTMTLTTIGALVQGFWYEIPHHFPFVHLGAFTVMPNHIHGILIIDKAGFVSDDNATDDENSTQNDAVGRDEHIPDFRTPAEKRINTQGRHTASSIIGSFKSICTKHINQIYPEQNFEWQERFWDNIIHDDRAFDEITNYIHLNREKWDKDRFFDK